MHSILIIDGGVQGNRVIEFINYIRSRVSSEQLDIKYSISNSDERGNYHSLKNFRYAFIHRSDNISKTGIPLFNEEAFSLKVPLVLFSGGITDSKKINKYIFEINDNLLKQIITDYLLRLINNDFKDIDFQLLEEMVKNIKSVENNGNDTVEILRSIKHDFLNRISRILPEIKMLLTQIDNKSSFADISLLDFNNEFLISELNKIFIKLDKIKDKSGRTKTDPKQILLSDIILLITKITEMISGFSSGSSWNNIQKENLKTFTETIEQIKNNFEELINGCNNE